MSNRNSVLLLALTLLLVLSASALARDAQPAEVGHTWSQDVDLDPGESEESASGGTLAHAGPTGAKLKYCSGYVAGEKTHEPHTLVKGDGTLVTVHGNGENTTVSGKSHTTNLKADVTGCSIHAHGSGTVNTNGATGNTIKTSGHVTVNT